MRRLLRLAAWLYPPAWRDRYGAEFEALLDDAGPGWPELADVLKGAIHMQLTHWNFTRIVAVCGVLGIAGAAAIAFRMHDSYVSTAVLHIDRVGMPPVESDAERLWKTRIEVLSRSSLAALIQQFDLYPDERKTLPLEAVVQEMRNSHIQIVAIRDGRNLSSGGWAFPAFEIRFSYPDRAKAQAVTRELTNRMIAGSLPSTLSVLDPASLPSKPFYPNRPAMIVAGLVIGLAAGMLLVGIRRWPIVTLAGIAGILVAGAISFAIPDKWVSTAVVRVKPAEAAVRIASRIRQVARGADVQVLAVSGRLPETTGALQIRSMDHDRFKAQATVRKLVTRLMEDSAAKPAAGSVIDAVEVLDPASLPERPSSPNRLSIVTLGLLAGLLLGAIWRRIRPRPALALPAVLLALLGAGNAQTTDRADRFEVASVKPAAPLPASGGFRTLPSRRVDPGQLRYPNVTLKFVLAKAYGVEFFRIAGPAWLESERYDIFAKVPPGATGEQMNRMLTNLLADRFQVVLHRENRDLPFYALMVAKNGPKLAKSAVATEAAAPADGSAAPEGPPKLKMGQDGFYDPVRPRPGINLEFGGPGRVRFAITRQSLAQFAAFLSGQLFCPVADQTSLSGDYDFHVDFTPGDGQTPRGPGGEEMPLRPGPPGEEGPDLFAALQEQVGLKLEKRKGPVEMLVIDHAEKVPTGN